MPDDSRKAYLNKFSADMGKAIADTLAAADLRNTLPSCLNCAFFNESAQWCGKVGQHPPPRVIVYSCGLYEDAEKVPF